MGSGLRIDDSGVSIRERKTDRSDEHDVAAGSAGDGPSAFVNQPVVVVAEGDQIVEVGGAAMRPVHKVVNVDPSGPITTGEAAAVIAPLHLTSEPRWDLSRSSADTDCAA